MLPVSAFFGFPDEEKPLRHRLRVEAEDGAPLWLAAIWERHAAYGLDSVSVVTCEPMEIFKGLHSRSPVILDPGQLALWLDPQQQDAAAIGTMMKPRSSKGSRLLQEPWGKPDPNLDLFEGGER